MDFALDRDDFFFDLMWVLPFRSSESLVLLSMSTDVVIVVYGLEMDSTFAYRLSLSLKWYHTMRLLTLWLYCALLEQELRSLESRLK